MMGWCYSNKLKVLLLAALLIVEATAVLSDEPDVTASTVGGEMPADALAGAQQCVCPKGYRQVLNTDTCACECDNGFQGTRWAIKNTCTVMYPGQSQPGQARCKCSRCPRGTTSGGGYMNSTQCIAAPGDSVSVQQSQPVIPYNMQCGGRGSTVVGGFPGCGTPGRECWDAPWTGVTCAANTRCVRSNEWWWFCNWASSTPPTQTVIPAWAQCGGRSTTTVNGLPGCGSAGRECIDGPWSGVRCVDGHSCSRDNEWWWACKPGAGNPCAGRTCNGRGTCSNGVCNCQAGWTGANCETQVTPNPCAGRTCNGRGTCSNGVCNCQAGWTGANCETQVTPNPCAGRTCNGRGTCSNGVCNCQAGWTGANCETQVPVSGCPAGWKRAVTTIYESWPFPNSQEWNNYNGGTWTGQFSDLWAYAGHPGQRGQVQVSQARCSTTDATCQNRAMPNPTQWRWSEAAVSRMMMASVPRHDPQGEQLIGRKIRVMVPGGRTILVNALDTCGDWDCQGCCTRNAQGGVLIDLEKHAARALFGYNERHNDISVSNGVATYSNPTGRMFDVSRISSVNVNREVCYQVTNIRATTTGDANGIPTDDNGNAIPL